MAAKLKKFEFTQNQEAIVNDELVIPVPDGYQFYSEVEEGTGTRLLVITPKGYSRDKDPYDAEFAMSIPQSINIGLPFDADKSEVYKSIFTSQFPVFTENIIIDEVGCRENFGILHQNFYDNSDPSYNKVLAIIFVNTGAYISHIYFNHPGSDARDQELINRFLSAVDEWMLRFRLTTEDSDSVKAIPISVPDEMLYPRYHRAINDPLASLGAVVVRNPAGTDYQFISFSKMIDNGLSDEADPVFRRIKDADKGIFSLVTEAEKYKTVFRVSALAFNEKHDRECEIDEGYIQKDYMLVGLRSFAWTLASYCSQYNTEPAQMSFDDFKRIADYCEKHDWLNFNNFSYCRGLCDCGDLHIYYIPDSVSDSDRKFIEPTQEDYDRVESMRKKFPNYNEILSEVKSLDKLREDLTYVYPAMTAIYEKLSAERNFKEELTGNCADLLYAWCAIVKAAKEPFYIEDGPMNCWFTQNESVESFGATKETFGKQPVNKTPSDSNDSITASLHDSIEVVQLTEKSKGVRFNLGEFEGYDGDEVHIALPEGTDTVGYNAFNCEYSVKTVVIPEGTTSIDMDAFSLAKISCVVFPSTLGTIASGAFHWCENLKEVILPDGLTEIGDDAFSGCDNLKYIYIPASVFDFGSDCFYGLDNCIFHVEPGSDAEEYIRKNYEDYRIVYNKPAGYGNQPVINIISRLAVVGSDGFVTIEPDDEDVDSDYDGELTKYSGEAKFIRISDEFDRIESEAFYGNEYLEKVVIPSSITEMGDAVFCFCVNLKEITIQCDCELLPPVIFAQCHSIEKMVLPNSITVIDEGAFAQCKKLNSIILPAALTRIGLEAFTECESLESIEVPDTVTSIEKGAFSKCSRLKTVKLSNSLETIGEDAFCDCESLESITIPDGVKAIGDYAFRGCKNLKNVITGSAVDKIGEDIFLDCESLDVTKLPDAFQGIISGEVSADGEMDNPQLKYFTIENGVLTKVKKTIEGTVVIPSGVTKIAKKAFDECDKVTEIVVSEGVIEIESDAIRGINGVDNLRSIVLPSSLEVLGKMSYLKHLTEVVIPEKIKELSEDAFSSCNSLKRVVLPSGLVRIGANAFQDTAIEEIIIPDTVTYIGKSAFSVLLKPSQLKKVRMSRGVTEIGDSAFKKTLITDLELPDTLKTIGEWAFAECENLQNVKLSKNLTRIPEYAFEGCALLNNLVIGEKVKSIDAGAFSGCENLSQINIPNSVTKIGSGAFSGCSSIKRVIIPCSVKSIGDCAFSECKNLQDIYIPSSVSSFGEDEFGLNFYPFEPKIHIVKGSPADRFCQDNWIDNVVYETEESMKRIGKN